MIPSMDFLNVSVGTIGSLFMDREEFIRRIIIASTFAKKKKYVK